MTEKSELLTGADQIASYLGWPKRRIYHVARTRSLPIGHAGGLLIAFRSELDEALRDRIKKSMSEPRVA